MGANAVTSVPKYTAGEVLTAANLNITNSGIPVFATTVTRDAAFDGTGEKVLAEGQFAYIEANNATQYYDGSSWLPVGATPGLVCVKAETAFTSTASIVADNVFTSSYTNYRILFFATSAGSATAFVKLRVGGVSASTNYGFQLVNGVGSSVVAARVTAGTDGWRLGYAISTYCASDFMVYNPQLAQASQFTNTTNVGAGPELQVISGNHTTATAYDGIEITATANITGTYAIYGYSKTV